MFREALAQCTQLDQFLNGIKAQLDILNSFQRPLQPSPDKARSHRISSTVHHLEKAAAERTILHGRDNFKISLRLQIERHILTAVQLPYPRNVGKTALPGFLQILKNNTRSDFACTVAVNAKAFQGVGLELAGKHLPGLIFTEHPCVKFRNKGIT